MANGLFAVSCPATTLCVAVDPSGNGLTYDGSSWSTPSTIDGSAVLQSVSCPSSSFCAAVDHDGNALTYTVPTPSPFSYRPSFTSPAPGSSWPAGSVLPVRVELISQDGSPIPGSLAAELAANCAVRARASGAQPLRWHCLRYDRTTGEFSYDWRLADHGHGRDAIGAEVSYRTVYSQREQVKIGRGRPRHS